MRRATFLNPSAEVFVPKNRRRRTVPLPARCGALESRLAARRCCISAWPASVRVPRLVLGGVSVGLRASPSLLVALPSLPAPRENNNNNRNNTISSARCFEVVHSMCAAALLKGSLGSSMLHLLFAVWTSVSCCASLTRALDHACCCSCGISCAERWCCASL